MKKVEKGDKVKVHYTGTLNDGNKFDSSHDRGTPLNFEVGTGQMIEGFDSAVMGMETGDTKKVNLKPAQAYGEVNPKALTEVPTDSFPTDFKPKVDEMVQGSTIDGKPVIAKVKELKESTIVLDLNHPLAGQELNFEIELVEIEK